MRLSAEQRRFTAEVAAFCAKECGTLAQRDALTEGGTQADSPELLRRLAGQGWLGISLPAEHGGIGGGFVDECLFLETAARGLAPIAAYATGLTAAQTYLLCGTDAQKRTIVESLCAGQVEAIALSEPGSGSDLASARLAARRDGDEYVIDGQKTWISAAHHAAHILVLTRTDASGPKHRGLTLLMVPGDAPGLVTRPIDTMQPHVVNDVFFTGVRVITTAVVGTEGQAWAHLSRGLGVERLIIAAQSVGAAQRSLDDVVAYVQQREQFGVPIGTFQAVRHRLADVATEIAHCRAFLYDVADRIDAGDEDDLATLSSMAKLKATEVAKLAGLEAMQLMGGYGYAREYGMEAQVRRALAPPIYGGTNEIQREIISRGLGLAAPYPEVVVTHRSPFAADLLSGKRVLITGGGTGLGRGVARHLVEHGAEVHLWGRRLGVLEQAAAEAGAARPGSVHVQAVDVRDGDGVDAAMGTLWAEHGPLTSVVNNAAANFIAPTESLSPRAFDAVSSTVMKGSFHTTHAAGRRWIAEGLRGSVLSTLTTWVWTGSAFVTPSAMGKAAVHAMTMSLAVEWARYGIRLNALAPGPIPTDYAWDMLNPTDKSSVGATQADQIPMGRTGTVEELANLTMFLLSDACDYITGQTIAMDGGQMLAGPGTFAGLTAMTPQDWADAREKSKAASAAAKAQR